MEDREAKGPSITLPDGSTAKRLPGFRRWMWDGEFCGSLDSAMKDGNVLPKDKVIQTSIVFKGNTFRFPGSAEYATSKEGTIKLDETKTPRQMDAVSTEKEVMLGIYAIDANGYRVCFAPPDKPRPTEFTSTPENGQIYQYWLRQKKQ